MEGSKLIAQKSNYPKVVTGGKKNRGEEGKPRQEDEHGLPSRLRKRLDTHETADSSQNSASSLRAHQITTSNRFGRPTAMKKATPRPPAGQAGPNVQGYVDDQYQRWSSREEDDDRESSSSNDESSRGEDRSDGGGPKMDSLLPELPSTFNRKPEFVRRLSMSLNTAEPLLSTTVGKKKSGLTVNPADFADFGHVDGGEMGAGNVSGCRRRHQSDDDDEEEPFLVRLLGRSSAARRRRKKTRRVCEKGGAANVSYKNVSEKRRRYVVDLYTTLVDSRWSTSLFLFAMSFYLTWVIYAVIYYLICQAHGDFDGEYQKHWRKQNDNATFVPCILEVDGFAASFLFSLETQHTIGYGSRQTTTECVEAMIIMSTQSVIGCLIQAFMVGLVFAKLSTPNKRAKTVVFSKNAVICERDRKLCLVFRVGDMRHDSFIVGAQLSAKLIRRRVTDEGEMFHDVTPIEITPDSSNEPCVFLIWPITVIHVMDEESPFYRLSAPELASDKFEIHVVLEGTIEASGMTFQARTSYLPRELLWGHRFEPMMIYRKDHNKYQVNFAAFNSTYEVDTPLCSSRDLDQHYKDRERAHKRQQRQLREMRKNSAATAPPQTTIPQITVTDETIAAETGDAGRRSNNFMDGLAAQKRAMEAAQATDDESASSSEDGGSNSGQARSNSSKPDAAAAAAEEGAADSGGGGGGNDDRPELIGVGSITH